MPNTNVSAEWNEAGDLVLYDALKQEIFRVDGVNRKLTFASGATLDVDAAAAIISLADGSITKAKSKSFFSTEQTGTGSAQNVAHGLGVAPGSVLIALTELAAGLAAGADVAEGAHTSTNVVVTVTSGVKFKVFAWA